MALQRLSCKASQENRIPLRLAEAQQLYDGLNDPLLRPALEAFFSEQRELYLADLLASVLKPNRDFYRESYLAGKADAALTELLEMRHYAERQLREASQ